MAFSGELRGDLERKSDVDPIDRNDGIDLVDVVNGVKPLTPIASVINEAETCEIS